MEYKHVSVLLNECIENLNIKPDGLYIDGTLGGSGHSLEIVKKLSGTGRLICIDRDSDALENAAGVLKDYMSQITLVKSNFSEIDEILCRCGVDGADGILLDLGVSLHQLSDPSRGFSYMAESLLDMRMDTSDELSAFDVINGYTQKQLERIILDYGEERWARRIAEFIVSERQIRPISTTLELVSVVKKAIPKSVRQDGPHPAKRLFQAIRIEVNSELKVLDFAVKRMVDKLNPGGRICIISFHSLEDKIIKNVFRNLENPCICPKELPVCVCGKVKQLKIITRKPILPSKEEIDSNHMSRSAKLRVAQKL